MLVRVDFAAGCSTIAFDYFQQLTRSARFWKAAARGVHSGTKEDNFAALAPHKSNLENPNFRFAG
jgi:hypothetical protein